CIVSKWLNFLLCDTCGSKACCFVMFCSVYLLFVMILCYLV
ncbi:unnamed protein product, partial [Brassica oleracea]